MICDQISDRQENRATFKKSFNHSLPYTKSNEESCSSEIGQKTGLFKAWYTFHLFGLASPFSKGSETLRRDTGHVKKPLQDAKVSPAKKSAPNKKGILFAMNIFW
jgi:hypothetical protein